MNQGDVIQNRYAGSSKKGRRRGFEEVPILRAENIGFTDHRGLHDDSVVYIANRGDQ